jgi:branched-chain amino acid transport system permease protein
MDWTNFVNTFGDNTRDGLAIGSIYALIALGYTLVYGVLRLINFANSEVFMLGTFGSFVGLWALDVPQIGQEKTGMALLLTLAFCILLSMAFSGGSAVVVELVAYRPLRRRNAPRLVFLISAIGASFALSEAVGAFGAKKRDTYALPEILNTNKRLFSIGGTNILLRHFVVVTAALILMVGLYTFVNRTRLGRGMRAVAQDAETARIMGVNVDQVISLTFLIGGLMAGGAAFLYILYLPTTRYNVGFLLGIKSFTAAVLGGIGNIRGALLGGLVLGLVEKYGAGLFGGKWLDVIAFIVLVAVLMFRPTGLLGESLGRTRV